MVSVRVFGQNLLPCVEDPEMECELMGTPTVREFLEGDPEKFGGLLDFLHKGELMVTINQKISTLEAKLKDGDTLKLTHQFNPTLEGAMWHNP
jgi:molybdopterin converting factor small subunit